MDSAAGGGGAVLADDLRRGERVPLTHRSGAAGGVVAAAFFGGVALLCLCELFLGDGPWYGPLFGAVVGLLAAALTGAISYSFVRHSRFASLQLLPDGLRYWDWRDEGHEIEWSRVSKVAFSSLPGLFIALHYLSSDDEPRLLRLWWYEAWDKSVREVLIAALQEKTGCKAE
jgi:hypothetical protein